MRPCNFIFVLAAVASSGTGRDGHASSAVACTSASGKCRTGQLRNATRRSWRRHGVAKRQAYPQGFEPTITGVRTC